MAKTRPRISRGDDVVTIDADNMVLQRGVVVDTPRGEWTRVRWSGWVVVVDHPTHELELASDFKTPGESE